MLNLINQRRTKYNNLIHFKKIILSYRRSIEKILKISQCICLTLLFLIEQNYEYYKILFCISKKNVRIPI